MPYKKIEQLPEPVRAHLPTKGQIIYKEAFNSAWDQYDEPEERRDDRTREETAHAIAWNAVKKVYVKNDQGKWVKKSEELDKDNANYRIRFFFASFLLIPFLSPDVGESCVIVSFASSATFFVF